MVIYTSNLLQVCKTIAENAESMALTDDMIVKIISNATKISTPKLLYNEMINKFLDSKFLAAFRKHVDITEYYHTNFRYSFCDVLFQESKNNHFWESTVCVTIVPTIDDNYMEQLKSLNEKFVAYLQNERRGDSNYHGEVATMKYVLLFNDISTNSISASDFIKMGQYSGIKIVQLSSILY